MLVRRPGKVPLLLVGDLTYDVTRPTAEHHAEGRRPRITAHIRPRLQARRGAHRGLWPTMRQDAFVEPILNHENCRLW